MKDWFDLIIILRPISPDSLERMEGSNTKQRQPETDSEKLSSESLLLSNKMSMESDSSLLTAMNNNNNNTDLPHAT